MRPKPPCGPKCPRRCAVPNCHDGAVCGAWAAYQNALEKWRNENAAARRERDDLETALHGRKPRRRKERQQ